MFDHDHGVEDREWRITPEGRACRVHCTCGWVGGWRPAKVRASMLFDAHVVAYNEPLAG
jgi:hypothetical protein